MKNKALLLLITGFVSFFFFFVEPLMAGKKRILYVDSYHAGYEWSDGITRGILGVLNVTLNDDGTTDSSGSDDVQVKIIRMNTKLNKSDAFIQESALKAKTEIEAWNPDVVIASDDNASKYLVMPYLKDTKLPVVFCGVDWDASEYGFPAKNVTGMVEVTLISQLVETLKPYVEGERIGYLAHDNLTNKKSLERYRKEFKLNIFPRFVANFDEWKTGYIDLQNEVDMIILSPVTVPGWDGETASDYIKANTRIPTGAYQSGPARFALVSYVKVPEEQGAWAAKTALDILNGKSPADIPIVTNKKGKIYINLALSEKLGIKFPLNLLRIATIIE